MSEPDSVLELSVIEERYPRYDPAHATPDPMVRRVITIRGPKGEARFEQTDYGHPGRFNNWEPRGIAPALQARTSELQELCARVGSLLS